MRIDIDRVLRERIPRYYRFIPRFIVNRLADLICQDKLNELLQHNENLSGADFAEAVINDMSVTFDVAGHLPDAGNKRVIWVSNHPLGGLDGLVLATVAKKIYGGSIPAKFVVNDLLDFVEPLRPIFLGVNKFGVQSRTSASDIDEAFASDCPIIMFPAGLVSRMDGKGRVADLDWHKMAIVKAISYQRDIIPLHFSGNNSKFFYKFARLREKLGLRFNIEMVRLPKEVILSERAHYVLTFGQSIPFDSLKGGKDAISQANEIKEMVYKLPQQ